MNGERGEIVMVHVEEMMAFNPVSVTASNPNMEEKNAPHQQIWIQGLASMMFHVKVSKTLFDANFYKMTSSN